MDESWEHIRQTIRPLGQRPLRSWGHEKDPLILNTGAGVLSSRRLQRGQYEPEGVLDLHGLTIIQAHDRLQTFLARAQGDHKRLVLIITGKGKNSIPHERTLKQAFEEWMAFPNFRRYVASFSPAARRHGEEGAYYVVLKK
jgi:DNA-nicking Smr family endonuclease